MKEKRHKQRKRYFVAVEGESELSFLAFLQKIANEEDLAIHIDKVSLNGGGYEKMLSDAVKKRDKKGKGVQDILIVDSDRADRNEDAWDIDRLKSECKEAEFNLVVQKPNFESVIARLFRGNEARNFATKVEVDHELRRKWADYNKPEDLMRLAQKFSLEDVLRLADHDEDIKFLLDRLGFKN